MCIAGKPDRKLLNLPPSKGILAWREFEYVRPNEVVGTTDRDRYGRAVYTLEPRYVHGQHYTWQTGLAKASGRPTGKRGSDIGIHANRTPAYARVVGRVRLFGRVAVHRDGRNITGYLAEYAELVSLSRKYSGCVADLDKIAERHKVPVIG